jgi:UDP:flavonoid glycosyltransferase YjiC (YdhE family)
MTTGTGIDRASLRPAPNTTVRDFVPHGSVLPHVDLAICHAGHGTVMAALAHGVPLLCLPMGAGRTLAPESDAAAIRRVVAEALVDAAVRDGAREIASLIARRDGAAIAAEHLLAMLQSARTPRSFAHR